MVSVRGTLWHRAGFLAPGAKSEIGPLLLIFFPKKISKMVYPKQISVIFKNDKQRSKGPLLSFRHFFPSRSSLTWPYNAAPHNDVLHFASIHILDLECTYQYLVNFSDPPKLDSFPQIYLSTCAIFIHKLAGFQLGICRFSHD